MRLDHLAVVAVLVGSASLGSAAVGVNAIAGDLPAASRPAPAAAPGPGDGDRGRDCHRAAPRPDRLPGV